MSQVKTPTNKWLNTKNFILAVLGVGIVVEGIALSNKRWGGTISKNISRGLKVGGPIGVAAVSFLFGHWIDDADEHDSED